MSQITKAHIAALQAILADPKIDLPARRRKITKANVQWLLEHFEKWNSDHIDGTLIVDCLTQLDKKFEIAFGNN